MALPALNVVVPRSIVIPTRTAYEPFPEADPMIEPTGHDVLVQIRSPRTATEGGIILSDDSVDTEYWNQQVARVVAVGPVAHRNRTTLDPWPEGAWCSVGDYVRIPLFGGDRWEVDLGDEKKRGKALFALFKDTEIRGKLKSGVDPRLIKAYVVGRAPV